MIREIDSKLRGFHDATDKSKAALARAISGLHEAWLSQYPDFPVPTQSGEVQVAPLSKETQQLIERMKEDGYAVYDTMGLSPRALKANGMPYWYLDEKLADHVSPPALVAFKPTPLELFIPGSKGISYEDQVKLIPEEQAKVDKKYSGAGLVVRESTDWPELSWKHFKATDGKVRLFGSDFDNAFTWMPIYESEDPDVRRAIAGNWDDQRGFDVYFIGRRHVNPHLGLASLVEIPRI